LHFSIRGLKKSSYFPGISLDHGAVVTAYTRAVDPDSDPVQVSLDTVPDPIQIQGFDDQKLKKKIKMKFFFKSKIAIYS
jgi:hypothetical protein